MKPGLDTNAIRNEVVNKTGMTPGFYLEGTKMIVNHTLDLDFLKWINAMLVTIVWTLESIILALIL